MSSVFALPYFLRVEHFADDPELYETERWRKIVQGSAPAGIHANPDSNVITSAQDITFVAPAYNSGHQIVVPNPAAGTALAAVIAADGLTPGKPFPGNIVKANLLDPVALQVMGVGAVPKAKVSGDYDLGFEQTADERTRRPLPHRPQHQ